MKQNNINTCINSSVNMKVNNKKKSPSICLRKNQANKIESKIKYDEIL